MSAPLWASRVFPGLGVGTMKLLLLLVSLFVSDLSPLGDEDLAKVHCSWSLCRRLSGHVAPRGLGTHMLKCCIQNYGNKQWKCLFYRQDHGHCSSHRAITGIIHYRHFPITIVFLLLKEGKRFPGFLASDTPPVLCCVSGDTSTGGGISYIAVNKVNKCPDSQPVRFLHLHSAASGPDIQTFLLEKPESGATATTARWQKMLTKTNGAAAVVIISCCLEDGETRSAISMKEICSGQIAEAQTGQKDGKQQARDIKYLKQDDGQHPTAASVNQREFVEASALNSGSSSMKTDLSELETQTNAAGPMKTNLNLDDEPSLQNSPQEQFLMQSASRVDSDNDGDGFYGNRQLLLVSREKKEATQRQRYNLRPAQDNKTLNRKKITQQAELRPPEGERDKPGSRLNTVKDGNREASANVLNSDLTEEREEDLIPLFLPDTQMETKTDPASARTLTLSTDTGGKAGKELSGRPPVGLAQQIQINLLELNVIDKTPVEDLKSAERFTKAATGEEVKDTTEETENAETDSEPHEDTRINHIKQEGNVLPEESVIPAPPLNKVIEAGTMKAAAVNMDTKEATARMDAFNQSSTWKADGLPRTEPTGTSSPEPGSDSEPRRIKCNTRKPESRTGKLFTGLRMRDGVLADLMTLHRSEVKNADVAPTNRPGNGRGDDDPGGNSLKCSKPLELGHERAPDSRPTAVEAADEPLCRGLIDRTAAGWKHCVERFTGAKMQPEPATRDPEDSSPNHGQDHHFYYSDGVLRRVRFHPRGSQAGAARRRRRAQGNLLRYIQHLVLKNKPPGA